MDSASLLFFWVGLASAAIAFALFSKGAVFAGPRHAEELPRGGSTTRAGLGALALTFLAISIALVLRTVSAKAPPMADMWGYFLMMAAALAAALTATGLKWKEPSLSLVGSGIVVATLASAYLAFEPDPRPLIPALQANRILTLHVSAMVLTYAFIAIAFAGAVLYLVVNFTGTTRLAVSAQRAYDIGHWAAMAALPLMTLGLALGAWWANDAWGRYWGWDPKETMSLVTWLILVAYFHMQGLRRYRGTRAAWLLVAAFLSIVFNMVGVNFWISGLHSYA